MSLFFRTFEEDFPLLGHHIVFLLPHGLSEQVRLAHGIAGDFHRDLHDLFLVEDNPVSFFQERFQTRQRIFRIFQAVAAADVGIQHAGSNWTGPVHGVTGNQVFQLVRLELFQQVLHARGFKLENGLGVAMAEDLEYLFIVKSGERILHLGAGHPVPFFDQVQGHVNDGQGFQAQEVHFQQADVFRFILIILDHRYR